MDNLLITQAGRHKHSFKDCTLQGLAFLVKASLDNAVIRDLKDIWDDLTISIKDNSDTNNPVDVLPPAFTLENMIMVQNAKELAKIANIKALPLNSTTTYFVPFSFDTNKVLKGDDQSIDVTVLVDSFTNFLQIQVVPIYGIGLEAFKYVIEELELDESKKRQRISIGRSVDSVIYQGDFEKIDRVKLESDILNFEKDSKELLQIGTQPFADLSSHYSKSIPHVLAQRTATSPTMSNVDLELDFSTVPSGHKLYIIRKITTPEVAQVFSQKVQEHEQENMQKIRLSSLNDCNCTKKS